MNMQFAPDLLPTKLRQCQRKKYLANSQGHSAITPKHRGARTGGFEWSSVLLTLLGGTVAISSGWLAGGTGYVRDATR